MNNPSKYGLTRKSHGHDGLTATFSTAEDAEQAITTIYPDAVSSDPDGHGNYHMYVNQETLDDGGEPVARIARLHSDE